MIASMINSMVAYVWLTSPQRIDDLRVVNPALSARGLPDGQDA